MAPVDMSNFMEEDFAPPAPVSTTPASSALGALLSKVSGQASVGLSIPDTAVQVYQARGLDIGTKDFSYDISSSVVTAALGFFQELTEAGTDLSPEEVAIQAFCLAVESEGPEKLQGLTERAKKSARTVLTQKAASSSS